MTNMKQEVKQEEVDEIMEDVLPNTPERKVSENCLKRINTPISIVKKFSCVQQNMKVNHLEFRQLVNLVKQSVAWGEHQRSEFIVQFFDDPDYFNYNCTDIVDAFCNLRWNLFSTEVRVRFVRFLTDIASYNPIHLVPVLRGIYINCLDVYPKTAVEADTLLNEECESIYHLGLEALYFLIPPHSMRVTLVPELMKKMKPYKGATLPEFLSCIRMAITLAHKYQTIAQELWFCIIDILLRFDSEVSSSVSTQHLTDVRQFFPKTKGNFIDMSDPDVEAMRRKLDVCMTVIFCYISLSAENPTVRPADNEYTMWMEGMTTSQNLFSLLFLALDAQVFAAHEMENVPFVWFYMCSEYGSLVDRLLKELWHLVITPVKTPNDWKRAHNAVTFMAGFLARASFVEIGVAQHWLKCMIDWCVAYVNNARQITFAGGFQHGTFYATVQSVLFLFCFRYKEFNESDAIGDIRLWGIGRIVHSQLEPLNFIPRPLALFFASISRYMQIVYCNHIVNMTRDQSRIETCLPFLRYGLVRCGEIFEAHLRPFEPIKNDLVTVNSIRSRRTTEVIEENNDYDFMVDEDDGIEIDYE